METANSYISIAERIIRDTFFFLENEGYTARSEVLDSKVFMEGIQVSYINGAINREVSISYTKGKVENEIRYTFSSSIVRLPYNGIHDYLALSVYLSSKGKDFSTSIINQFDENEARVIVKKIARSLETYLYDVVKGKKWFKDYWPRW